MAGLLTVTELTSKVPEVKAIIGDQKPEYCYQCAKCTSGCTAAKVVPEYRPHEIVASVRMGLIEEILKSGILWACSECLKCTEYCPQDVSPVEVVLALKNIAVRMGYKPPETLVEMVKNTIEIGYIQDVMEVMTTEFELVNRDTLNLPKLGTPPNMDQRKAALMRFFGVVMK